MRDRLTVFLAAAFILCALSLPAGADDTSPYLMGIWESGIYTYTNTVAFTMYTATNFQIANPTTKDLDVYAVFYPPQGVIPGPCYKCAGADAIKANGTCVFSTYFFDHFTGFPYASGTVKFFAFPKGTTKFDPNAVIGGFQGKFSALDVEPFQGPPLTTWIKANLKAVTINSSTIGEFSRIPWTNCLGPNT
jgi:hypothetical protein